MTARRMDGVSRYAIETYVPTTGSALNWICEFDTYPFDAPASGANVVGSSFATLIRTSRRDW